MFLRSLFARPEPPAARHAGRRQRLTHADANSVFYAIGDVHGCYDLLLQLESRIVEDSHRYQGREKVIVMLGDMIDRGPQSANVIEHLMADPPAGIIRYVLAGNHEAAMLAFLADPERDRLWIEIGGLATLASYGMTIPAGVISRRERRRLADTASVTVPEAHLRFLNGLPIALGWREYLFVHAGIRPGTSLERQTDNDLVEIREEFTACDLDHGVVVVHGHTSYPRPNRLANRVAVDLAPYATGRLAAARIDGPEVGFLVVGR